MNTVVNIAKSLRTPFLTIIWKRLLLPLEVFVNSSYENASFDILEDYMAATYIFLNYNCIWAYEISFLDRWEQPQSVS